MAPGSGRLASVLVRQPAASIPDVVAILTEIDRALPDSDGLKWFNRLYLEVTLAVQRAVDTGGAFRDPVFMAALDVTFANLYFEAAAAAENDPRSAPSAWRPLFLARQTPGLARIQCALAGMNAHINRDLPEAIIRCYRTMGGQPTIPSVRHEDFLRVNDILETVEEQVKPILAVGLVGVIDRVAGPVDDAAAMFSIRAARDAAWTQSQVLWQLGSSPVLRDAFFANLDRFTGLASRGLLVVRIDGSRLKTQGPSRPKPKAPSR